MLLNTGGHADADNSEFTRERRKSELSYLVFCIIYYSVKLCITKLLELLATTLNLITS